MSGSRAPSVPHGSRLVAALALTTALTAIGLTVVKDAAANTVPGAVPGAALTTLPPSGSPGTAVPTMTMTPSPPSGPTNVTATGVTTTSVTLSWTAAVKGCCAVAGYEISYTR